MFEESNPKNKYIGMPIEEAYKECSKKQKEKLSVFATCRDQKIRLEHMRDKPARVARRGLELLADVKKESPLKQSLDRSEENRKKLLKLACPLGGNAGIGFGESVVESLGFSRPGDAEELAVAVELSDGEDGETSWSSRTVEVRRESEKMEERERVTVPIAAPCTIVTGRKLKPMLSGLVK